MRAIFKRLQGNSRSDKYYIVPIGDTHLGAKNVDIKKIEGIVKWIAETPHVYWLGMGDYIDAVVMSDTKRFNRRALSDINDFDDMVNSQVKEFVRIFSPIKHRCLGLLDGNHEETIKQRYHVDPVSWLCRDLSVDYLTYECFMRVFFSRRKYTSKGGNGTSSITIFASHGYGSSRNAGGKLNQIINRSKSIDADIFISGHTHAKIGYDGERLVLTQRGNIPFIQKKKQIDAVTGTFLDTFGDGYNTYSGKAGYDPAPTGVIKILVEPFRQGTVTEEDKKYKIEMHPHIHVSA